MESTGADDWNIERRMDAAANAPLLTASTLQEMPSADSPGEAEAYRLIASCNSVTKEGEVQLAWSPAPQRGNLGVSVDGSASTAYRVEGSERMGNDSAVILNGLPSLALSETKRGGSRTGLQFPVESMTIRELFSGESVMFSFGDLPKDARQEFDACFPGAVSSRR